MTNVYFTVAVRAGDDISAARLTQEQLDKLKAYLKELANENREEL